MNEYEITFFISILYLMKLERFVFSILKFLVHDVRMPVAIGNSPFSKSRNLEPGISIVGAYFPGRDNQNECRRKKDQQKY